MITLTDDEAQAVARVLDKYMSELDYEIARIKRERDRRQLMQLERVLVALRKKL